MAIFISWLSFRYAFDVLAVSLEIASENRIPRDASISPQRKDPRARARVRGFFGNDITIAAC